MEEQTKTIYGDKGYTNPFAEGIEIKHAQWNDFEGDDDHRTVTLDTDVLSNVLFAGMYHIDSMSIEDGKLAMVVEYTGNVPLTDNKRYFCWDIQSDGRHGITQYNSIRKKASEIGITA